MTPDDRVRAACEEITRLLSVRWYNAGALGFEVNRDEQITVDADVLAIVETFHAAVQAEAVKPTQCYSWTQEHGRCAHEARICALCHQGVRVDSEEAERQRWFDGMRAEGIAPTITESPIQAIARVRREAREFDARFADTLKEFGTIERLVDAYREAKMQIRKHQGSHIQRNGGCPACADFIDSAKTEGRREGLAEGLALGRQEAESK